MNNELNRLQQGLLLNWENSLNEYISLCNNPNSTEKEKKETYIKIIKLQAKLEEMNIDYIGIITSKMEKLQQGLSKSWEELMNNYIAVCNNPNATSEEKKQIYFQMKILDIKLKDINKTLQNINRIKENDLRRK